MYSSLRINGIGKRGRESGCVLLVPPAFPPYGSAYAAPILSPPPIPELSLNAEDCQDSPVPWALSILELRVVTPCLVPGSFAWLGISSRQSRLARRLALPRGDDEGGQCVRKARTPESEGVPRLAAGLPLPKTHGPRPARRSGPVVVVICERTAGDGLVFSSQRQAKLLRRP